MIIFYFLKYYVGLVVMASFSGTMVLVMFGVVLFLVWKQRGRYTSFGSSDAGEIFN
jgi:hypothetical protein